MHTDCAAFIAMPCFSDRVPRREGQRGFWKPCEGSVGWSRLCAGHKWRCESSNADVTVGEKCTSKRQWLELSSLACDEECGGVGVKHESTAVIAPSRLWPCLAPRNGVIFLMQVTALHLVDHSSLQSSNSRRYLPHTLHTARVRCRESHDRTQSSTCCPTFPAHLWSTTVSCLSYV